MMSESQTQTKETVVTVEAKPAQPAGSEGGIKININYFRTIPGMLKLAQFLIGIICMACAGNGYGSSISWYLFVATTAFIGTVIWIFFYFLSLAAALSFLPINWLLTELIYTGIYAVLYLIAFVVAFVTAPHQWYSGAIYAAAVFGMVNCGLYGFGAFLLYKDWKGI